MLEKKKMEVDTRSDFGRRGVREERILRWWESLQMRNGGVGGR